MNYNLSEKSCPNNIDFVRLLEYKLNQFKHIVLYL